MSLCLQANDVADENQSENEAATKIQVIIYIFLYISLIYFYIGTLPGAFG